MSLDVTFGRSEMNTATAGIDFSPAANIPQVDTTSAGGNFHFAAALADFDAAATALYAGGLRRGNDFDAAAAGFGNQFAVGVMHFNGAAAGVQANVPVDGADFDGTAASFAVGPAADVVEMHAAATALRLYATSDSGGGNVAAFGFDFYQANFARDIDGKFTGKLSRAAALPIAHDPGCISAHICADLEGLELTAGVLLRRSIGTSMNNVVNTLLLSSVNHYGAHVYLDL